MPKAMFPCTHVKENTENPSKEISMPGLSLLTVYYGERIIFIGSRIVIKRTSDSRISIVLKKNKLESRYLPI
jgi:hypothetical protein